MVSQAIYLDSKRIEHVDIIRQIEKGLGFPVLDTYFRIGHGSAFFISSDGYAITNEHCVKPLTRDNSTLEQQNYSNAAKACINLVEPSILLNLGFGMPVTDTSVRTSEYDFQYLQINGQTVPNNRVYGFYRLVHGTSS